MICQQVVQPAAVPQHALPGDGVVLRHRRVLSIDVHLIGSSAQEERGRTVRNGTLNAVAVVVESEGPSVSTDSDGGEPPLCIEPWVRDTT